MENKTGIDPSWNRIVVMPDEVERVSEGGIVIPDTEAEKHQMAQSTGYLVAHGPDAFKENTTITERMDPESGKWVPFEKTVTAYSGTFADVGDRIAYAKYGGQPFIGDDGLECRLMNDTDITARISDTVTFTDLHARKRLGVA